MRRLHLVTDQRPAEPVQMGFAFEGVPNADVELRSLPAYMQFDAALDEVPRRRESMAAIDAYTEGITELMSGLDPLEAARTALTGYVDADGTARSRYQQLGIAPAI